MLYSSSLESASSASSPSSPSSSSPSSSPSSSAASALSASGSAGSSISGSSSSDSMAMPDFISRNRRDEKSFASSIAKPLFSSAASYSSVARSRVSALIASASASALAFSVAMMGWRGLISSVFLEIMNCALDGSAKACAFMMRSRLAL